ncbi:class I SAM-dependent methyltransferase [Terracoccus luteus]|uniref:SAM-dependent methyltransferase n=1 Tax=Terracoccus luteus TaxID=53356 RepID=A0A839PW11_9MICO|nr:class I SAM-dependent methyltransferase [Terracoccus luteus]MBB2988280.1 SAM-dependent methyltransferase [Terracoccus luteus]MCP2173915.1 SAM-dependent methyltransferase [Terracoccus luteus]
MGWWARQVVPRLVAGGGDEPKVLTLRARACDGLEGRVVELGFGSGPNLRVLPAAVTEVVAVEPSDVAWRLSQPARDASPVPVTRGGLDAGRLDLPDGSADAVLSTLTLCTVPDAATALAEVRRVLRPGGTLHLLEHGLAPDAPVRRWQHRLDPLQRRLFDGCHLTRPVDELVAASGLTVEAMEREYGPFPRPLRPWGFLYVGRARRT